MIELCTEPFTPQWETLRRARITSQGIEAVLGRDGTKAKLLLTDELTEDLEGIPDHKDLHPDKWILEKRAQRAAAAEWYARARHVKLRLSGFVIHSSFPWLGFTPCGFVDPSGMIYIQCRSSLATLEANRAPKKPAMRRIQFELLVSGRAWCDYVNYYPGAHKVQMGSVHRVERDPVLIRIIEEKALIYWRDVLAIYKGRRKA